MPEDELDIPEKKTIEFSVLMVITPFLFQVLLIFGGTITPDGGGAFNFFLGGILSHLLGCVLIVTKRGKALTKADQVYLHIGFLLFYLLSGFFIVMWIHVAQRMRWPWLYPTW